MFRKFALASLAFSGYMIDPKKDPECCGIIGVVSQRPISEQEVKKDPKSRISIENFLCDGVELLKNRGYDSAGIFRFGNGMPQGKLIKYADDGNSHVNCIDRVVEQVLIQTGITTTGIAHTRWATCGGKVSYNAHPHFDESNRFHIVHNGIINNHGQIKNKYLSGVKFSSETDTEVIVQFIASEIKEGKTIVEALQKFSSIAEKTSQWGVMICDKEQPDKIYTSTWGGSPLLIGFSVNEDQIYVVSEKIAFQWYASCYFPTNDGQIIELNVQKIPEIKEKYKGRLIDITNPPPVLKKPPQPFKTFYSYEISQEGTLPFQPNFWKMKDTVRFGSYLSLIACGSSYFAAYASEPFFKRLKCFKKLNITDPAELDQHDITEDETVVVISQSGETKDLITIVDDMRKKEKVNTIGIINVEGSTIARKVDFPIYIGVGRQTCVAATKSFFHQVLNLIQFSTEVAEQKQTAPIEVIQEIRKELRIVPGFVQGILDENREKCAQLAKNLFDKHSIFLLGKRESMAIAREAALKIKELNYIHAEAMGAAEMKHGPIALIDSRPGFEKSTVVFLWILDNETFPYLMNALDQMHSRNAYVVVITDCIDKLKENFELEKIKYNQWKDQLTREYEVKANELRNDAEKWKTYQETHKREFNGRREPEQKYDFVLTLPHLKYMSALLSIIPIQLFVEQMAILKQINPDYPRNLAKSVTV